MKVAICCFFLLTLSALCALTSCGPRAQDSLYLIPQGYTGPVLIVFEQKDGQATEYEKDKRIYRVPVSGVLRSQFAVDSGVFRPTFLFIDKEGRYTPIRYMTEKEWSKKSLDRNSEEIVCAHHSMSLQQAGNQKIFYEAFSILPLKEALAGDSLQKAFVQTELSKIEIQKQ